MKKTLIVLAVLALAVSAVCAAPTIKAKYSGPQGQGNLIYYAPSTGTTNITMTASGVSVLTLVDGSLAVGDLAVASNKVIIGNGSGVGAAVSVSGDIGVTIAGVASITAGAIVNADLATNAVTSPKILDGTLVNADVNASAAIALTKLAGGSATNAQTAGTSLKIGYGTVTNAGTATWPEVLTAVIYAAIESGNATSNAYFSSVNTTNGTAVVPQGGAARYIVIGR